MSKVTNEELVVAFQQGKLSFDEIYPAFEKLVYREASKWTIKDMDKDDIQSELMMALYEACQKFDSSLGYKFSTFAVNHLRYRIREEWRKTTLPKYGSEWTICSADGELGFKARRIYEAGLMKVHQDAIDVVLEKELIEKIEAHMKTLSPTDQFILSSLLFKDKQKADIARELGRSPQHIQNCVKRICHPLQLQLTREAKSW